MAGRVKVDGVIADKPGQRVAPGAEVTVELPPHRYVSRGGVKLESALASFNIDVSGRACLDAGASTGGFTDCLLSHGASRVYAVDVGYGLLAWSLRTDPRVVPLERTNARYLDRRQFADAVLAAGRDLLWPTIATCDVSFISLLKVVPALRTVLDSPWQMVLLVKPQFEAGRGRVGSKGVVRDPPVHVEVLCELVSGLEHLGAVSGLTWSPLRGPEGNIEYLLWLVEGQSQRSATEEPGEDPYWNAAALESLVDEAFRSAPRS